MAALLVAEGVVEADEDGFITTLLGIEHGFLPQAVVANELAVDPGLADPQLGLGLELILDGGERHVARVKQHQCLLDPPISWLISLMLRLSKGRSSTPVILGWPTSPL